MVSMNSHISISDLLEKTNKKIAEKANCGVCMPSTGGYFLYLAESKLFNLFTLAVIITNTILLALQSIPDIKARAGWHLTLADSVFLSIYVVEIIIKFLAYRLRFFRDLWNVFDLVIVLAANLEFMVMIVTMYLQIQGSEVVHIFNFLRALKATRAIRALRAIRFLKKLQIIVTTVLRSVPAFSSLFLLIGLVAFNFAVVGRGLYGEIAPRYFGNLFRALVTSFQLITLDDWAALYHTVTEKYPERTIDLLVYLVLYMGIEAFIFINLFVAVIVDNLSRAQHAAELLQKEQETIDTDNENDDADIIQKSNNTRKNNTESKINNNNQLEEALYANSNYSKKEVSIIRQIHQLLASMEASYYTAQGQQETVSLLVDVIDFTQCPNAAEVKPKFFNKA